MSSSLQQAYHHPPEGSPFNITIVQVFAPTSDYDDKEIEEFYDQLQNVVDQTPKKGILVVQGDWNAKVGKDACGNWQGICGPFCNDDTSERGLCVAFHQFSRQFSVFTLCFPVLFLPHWSFQLYIFL